MAVVAKHFESMSHDEEVSQSEFARRVGCTKQNISKLVVAGKIKKNANGKLDYHAALKDYEDNTDATHHERLSRSGNTVEAKADTATPPVTTKIDKPGDPDLPDSISVASYKKHRSSREAANAKLANLKADQLAGELIPALKVEKDAFNMARGLRDAILAVPERVAAIIAAQSDDREVAKILHEELEKALNGLIDSMQKHGSDG